MTSMHLRHYCRDFWDAERSQCRLLYLKGLHEFHSSSGMDGLDSLPGTWAERNHSKGWICGKKTGSHCDCWNTMIKWMSTRFKLLISWDERCPRWVLATKKLHLSKKKYAMTTLILLSTYSCGDVSPFATHVEGPECWAKVDHTSKVMNQRGAEAVICLFFGSRIRDLQ